MIGSWQDNFRTRIPSISNFFRKVAADRRYLAYDLLPLFSTPRARHWAAALIARGQPKTPAFAPSATAEIWCREMKADGIVQTLPPLSPHQLSAMRDYFEAELCFDPYRSHLGRFRFDAPASPETNMGYYDAQQILAAPYLLELLNDPVVLETAELYLGCKPLLDNLGAWWSYPGRPAAKGTQRYHRDFDSFGGFKLFIYLTDVDADSGPHLFMRGSHRSALLNTGRACPDDLVYDTFGREAEVCVTGAAGSRFICDTFALHKGLLPRQGARLLVSAQYNVNASPHLPRAPLLSRIDGYDPAVNRLIMDS